MSSTVDDWIVIVPVKPSAIGKSRLDGAGVDRAELARAIALDTIEAASAARGVAAVIVVTDDAGVGAAAAQFPRVRVIPEGTERGLNAALSTGAAAAGEHAPRAALLGDLPALRGDDLAVALEAAASVDRSVVADAEGTGSTLVTARAGTVWQAAFGPDSFARHTELGCVPLTVAHASTLRRDVDTSAQLEAAAGLGLGARTAGVLAARRSA